jgi:hypothetical protein
LHIRRYHRKARNARRLLWLRGNHPFRNEEAPICVIVFFVAKTLISPPRSAGLSHRRNIVSAMLDSVPDFAEPRHVLAVARGYRFVCGGADTREGRQSKGLGTISRLQFSRLETYMA